MPLPVVIDAAGIVYAEPGLCNGRVSVRPVDRQKHRRAAVLYQLSINICSRDPCSAANDSERTRLNADLLYLSDIR